MTYRRYEPTQKFFYLRNQKTRTAGFDKWIFEKMTSKYYAIFKNTRTGNSKIIRVENNKVRSATGFRPFFILMEYYDYMEKNWKIYMSDNTQYKFEKENLKEKYPEYFI